MVVWLPSPAANTAIAPGEQGQQHTRDDRRMQRVHLGDDRLRPEHAARRESPCGCKADDPSAPEPAGDEEYQRNGDRTEQRGEGVDAIRQRSEWQQRYRVREEHVQRVSRVVRDAEDAPDELEHRRVEKGDEPGRERPRVDHQRRGASTGRIERV